ncbi:MAG: hypothetical protein K2W85_00030 [Phycisphaerales bacterium]|nr:hypothetical protein [Phycisphaerales bacterium]
MFPVRSKLLILHLLAAMSFDGTAACWAAAPRTIAVEVRLTTPAGSPAEAGVPVTVIMCRRDWKRERSDAAGVARFSIDIADGCEWIMVYVSQIPSARKGMTAELQEYDRVQSLEQSWSVPAPVTFRLVPDQSSYVIDLPLVPAITVSGKVVAPSGERRGVRVDRDGRMNMGVFRGLVTGKFEVTGVPKGKDSLLYISVSNESTQSFWTRIHELNAAQAQASVDLGTIVEDPPSEMISTSVTVTDFRVPPANRYPNGLVLVAIRSDGRYAIPDAFWRQADALDPAAHSLTMSMKLPVGTWYLFPLATDEVQLVPSIRRLLAGDTATIDAANIPKVVVIAAQPPAPVPSVTIDFWPTLERMLTITPPPPPPPPPAPPAP